MDPFQSIRNYEEYIYTLMQRHESIKRSTLIISRRGKRTAVVLGEITFDKGHRITLKERISFDTDQVIIESYGYELWFNEEKFGWYDSQPHMNEPNLASTSPHHKHVPPNIKRNRIPAPNMHFDQPNIQFLIQEIESLLK